jgi:hypothetical protein
MEKYGNSNEFEHDQGTLRIHSLNFHCPNWSSWATQHFFMETIEVSIGSTFGAPQFDQPAVWKFNQH